MPDLSYTLFDTAAFGTVANTEFLLFKVPQGGDATHTETFTNMRGAGALSSEEKFVCQWIGAYPDVALAQADTLGWTRGTTLQLRVADRILFWAPIQVVVTNAMYGGVNNQAAAANFAALGAYGLGFALALPVTIPGGVPFTVRLFQGTALAAASQNIKVVLAGVLTIPG